MSMRLTATVLSAPFLLFCLVSSLCAQEVAQTAGIQVEFISTTVTQPDPIEQLWKYLDNSSLQGPSPDLLALNGLRAGVLDAGFRKEFEAVLRRTDVPRRIPEGMMMLPGRAQEFIIGPVLTDRTVFVWKSPTSFIGRRFSRANYGMAVMAQPDANQRCDISVTPLLRYGDALNQYLDLNFLGVTASLQKGQSIILMPTAGTPAGLGTAFYWNNDRGGRLRTFVVITLTSVSKPEPR